MDATSPVAARIAGDHSDGSPGVAKLLPFLVARLTFRFGDETGSPHRRTDHTPARELPA